MSSKTLQRFLDEEELDVYQRGVGSPGSSATRRHKELSAEKRQAKRHKLHEQQKIREQLRIKKGRRKGYEDNEQEEEEEEEPSKTKEQSTKKSSVSSSSSSSSYLPDKMVKLSMSGDLEGGKGMAEEEIRKKHETLNEVLSLESQLNFEKIQTELKRIGLTLKRVSPWRKDTRDQKREIFDENGRVVFQIFVPRSGKTSRSGYKPRGVISVVFGDDTQLNLSDLDTNYNAAILQVKEPQRTVLELPSTFATKSRYGTSLYPPLIGSEKQQHQVFVLLHTPEYCHPAVSRKIGIQGVTRGVLCARFHNPTSGEVTFEDWLKKAGGLKPLDLRTIDPWIASRELGSGFVPIDTDWVHSFGYSNWGIEITWFVPILKLTKEYSVFTALLNHLRSVERNPGYVINAKGGVPTPDEDLVNRYTVSNFCKKPTEMEVILKSDFKSWKRPEFYSKQSTVTLPYRASRVPLFVRGQVDDHHFGDWHLISTQSTTLSTYGTQDGCDWVNNFDTRT